MAGAFEPYRFSQHVLIVTRSVQSNVTAFLNRNNNGNSKEADSNVETATAIAGSKSYQGLSKGLTSTRQKPRYGYLNRRHPEVHRTRDEGQARCPIQHNNTCVGIENTAKVSVQDNIRRNRNRQTDTEILPRCQKTLDNGHLPSLEDIGEIEVGNQYAHATSDASVQTDHHCGPPCFSDLFQEISLVKSISEVPESVKDGLLLLLCTPLLDGGYQSGGCAWSSLLWDPASSNHPRPCVAGCQSFHSAVTEVTDFTECYGSLEEEIPVQGCVDSHAKDLPCTGSKGDQGEEVGHFLCCICLCFRTESPQSYLHDDFIHEDDFLDIPTLSILSPSRASLGHAYSIGHAITSLSIQDHGEDKPANHEPFPSEYVFKKVCGPSFRVSSDFRHIKVPTLPPDIVDYKVVPGGLAKAVIGSGSFGKVFAATLTVSPGHSRDVVVKEHFTDKTTQESIANEAKITMYLESTGCVPICYGLLSDEEDGYKIVMEYVGSGLTLCDILCDARVPGLHWLNIVCQITSGLNKIHKKDVLVNDLKSDNILVDMSGTLPLVKFCDMGSASYKSGVKYRGNMKNCVHLAPEACTHAETTAACDIYSLGRVLKKIHGVSHISTLLAVSDMCMAKDPAVRPTLWTVNQLMQEEYTKEVLFPTLSIPPHGYLDSIDEESQGESAESVLRVNTPVDKDSPKASGCSSDVKDRVSDTCTMVSQKSTKFTSRENNKMLRAPSVLPTERQCRTASISGIPRFRAQTKTLRSKATSVSTRGHIQDRNDTTVRMDGPSCSNGIFETKSLDDNDNCSSAEIAERIGIGATKESDDQQNRVRLFATPESSPSTEFAEKISFVARRKYVARQSQECHFAPLESSLSAVAAKETSDAATRKYVTGHNHERHITAPVSSSATDVAEKTSGVATRNADARKSHECQFASPESSSSIEIPQEISDVATRKSVSDQSQECHFCPFATPEASSTDVPRRSQSSSDAPTVEDFHCLSQAELGVYMQREDTVYEDYLPLVLPLLMLLFWVVGVVEI
ncbi:uncharacterized protein [Haliotis asinina]|uniref:uncharacterized protein n=1 Tax=Haliotis asinina TaxID=109174 RepID=UPI0035323C1A